MDKQELIDFENEVVDIFNDGKLKSPIHLSGGNESQLITVFDRIKPTDWVFSTYRGHYHSLLHGIDKDWLKEWILDNKSIHVMNSKHKFWTSAIVGGSIPVALGVAISINLNSQRKKDASSLSDEHLESRSKNGGRQLRESMPVDADNHADNHVWCFVGDMTAHTGIFWECIKYAHFNELPLTFVIEDNELSTDTPTGEAWGLDNQSYFNILAKIFPGRMVYYKYKRKWPHYGTGKFISKIWEGVDETKEKGF